MATTYKYRKRFTIDGKIYNVYSNDPKELERKYERKKIEIEQGRKIVNSSMLASDWFAECIKIYKSNVSPKRERILQSMINSAFNPVIGNLRLKDIKPVHCQNVLNNYKGYSSGYIKGIHTLLKFVFEKAEENELINVSPARKLTLPKGKVNKRRALTAKERKYFIEVGMNNKQFHVFMLMLFCGCRPTEAIECQGRDIEFFDGLPVLHIRGTKTQNSDRLVPIPDILYQVIKDTPKMESIALSDRGKKLTYINLYGHWKKFEKAVNIAMGCKVYNSELIPPYPLADDLVPYCLRHEFCTELARKGVALTVAKNLMGHSSIKITADIYTNIVDSDYIKSVSDIFNGKQESDNVDVLCS